MELKTSFKKYLKKSTPMLENLLAYSRNSNVETQKILSCTFLEKIVLENERVVIILLTIPKLVLVKDQSFRRVRNKREI